MTERATRRDFLKRAAVGGVALAGLPAVIGAQASASAPKSPKTCVVIARDTAMFSKDRANQAAVEKALRRSMVALTGKKNAESAWSSLFKPEDVVGIKITGIFGKMYATRPEVVDAVIAGLVLAGVKHENIIVWDRASGDLRKSGFTPNKKGPGVIYYADDGDWGRQVKNGSFEGKISQVFDRITAPVNMPILKHHHVTGMTCALKNHYGSFENKGRFCRQTKPYMADLNGISDIKDKTRLILVDALKPQADDGPERVPTFLWDYYSLVIGTDPVAVDYQSLQIIEARRKELKRGSLAEKTKWLSQAAERGLGTNDPTRIDIIRT